MRIIAIVQARLGSSRLPGKVLKNINGFALLDLLVRRLKKSQRISKIVIATTKSLADDELAEFCSLNDIDCFRGSENNV